MPKEKKGGCPFCGRDHDAGVIVCPITGFSLRFADPQKALGEVIGGKYRLERVIGKGGMGTVYEAVNIQLDKRVAIKVLLPESSGIDQIAERFKREARSAASIGHENIVDVYDLDTTEEGVVYIVMELLVGTDLAEVIKSTGSLPLPRVATIGVQTARALGAAHERGIIHRDMKPENIFLVQKKGGERVKVVDFGIAMIKEHGSLSRLTTDGILLGTPYYMSPEQARGVKELDHRVDIYALGAVLFEALTGSVLFPGNSYLEVISKHQLEPPPRLCEKKPDLVLPQQVETIIMKMLEKDPSRRPASMQEVEEALLPFSNEVSRPYLVVSGKFEEMAETLAASPPLELEGGAPAHTTPVKWEEPEKRKKPLSAKALFVAAGIVIAFVLSGAVAMLLIEGPSQKRQREDGRSFPINRAVSQPPPSMAKIKIVVFPENAQVTVDGKPIAKNPGEIEVPRSSTTTVIISAEAEGYAPAVFKVTPDRDQTINFSLEKVSLPKPHAKKGRVAAPEAPRKGQEESTRPAGGKKGIKEMQLQEESPYK